MLYILIELSFIYKNIASLLIFVEQFLSNSTKKIVTGTEWIRDRCGNERIDVTCLNYFFSKNDYPLFFILILIIDLIFVILYRKNLHISSCFFHEYGIIMDYIFYTHLLCLCLKCMYEKGCSIILAFTIYDNSMDFRQAFTLNN